jgi:hypothetical protein
VDKGGAGPALSLKVDRGAPLAVNKQARVVNLNADKLDGRDSTDFAPALYSDSNLIGHSTTDSNAGSALCDPGDKAVSGGYELIDATDNAWKSAPAGDRWTAAWRSSDGSAALGEPCT